jgi:hypothetical protein
MRRTLILTIVLSATAVPALAQQMPVPKPGPEHELLKADAGTWDAVVEFMPGPGAPAMISKGVEVNRMGCGGLCLISEFTGEAMGSPFQGVGVTAWDPSKKAYVGSWTDSMSAGISTMEATWDASAKTLRGWMEGPDPSGHRMKMRTAIEARGDTRVMTAFAPGPDGREMQVMKITYTRRK